MSPIAPAPVWNRIAGNSITDEEVVERVRGGDIDSYEILMRRYNQRLYRVAISILRNHAEAEDVMQEAYTRAYQHLNQFAGEAKFATRLTKIAINEALGHVRRRRQNVVGALSLDTNLHLLRSLRAEAGDPERQAYDHELKLTMEHAIDALPDIYRSVLVLRAVEGLSGAETAARLGIGEDAIKSRLHCALHMLRKPLGRDRRVGSHGKTGGSSSVATRHATEEVTLGGKAQYNRCYVTPLFDGAEFNMRTRQELGAEHLRVTRSPTKAYMAEPPKKPHGP
jgi:RNA polymerase sigma-70 factor (ECF subfamily)